LESICRSLATVTQRIRVLHSSQQIILLVNLSLHVMSA
jgi:hypothetical protein